MLSEAIRRHADTPRIPVDQIKLHIEAEPYRVSLAQQLQTYPYLWTALLGSRGQQVVLYRNADDVWSKPYPAGEKSAEKATRARIANGFTTTISTGVR